MIRFEHVTKIYKNGHQALFDVNFTLEDGEIAVLTGNSGAGKSTVLKSILMVQPVTRGHIFIDDHNLQKLPRRKIPFLRRQIGLITQTPLFLDQHNVFDNIALPLRVDGCTAYEIKRRVRAALDKVGLLSAANWLPSDLSCGEQQRVAIARAVVNKPIILLADEPTGNLDPILALEIMQLLQAFNDVGVTVLITTHALELAKAIKPRLLLLKEGILVS